MKPENFNARIFREQRINTSRIRDTRAFIGKLIDSKFGNKCITENRPFALAFKRAVS